MAHITDADLAPFRAPLLKLSREELIAKLPEEERKRLFSPDISKEGLVHLLATLDLIVSTMTKARGRMSSEAFHASLRERVLAATKEGESTTPFEMFMKIHGTVLAGLN